MPNSKEIVKRFSLICYQHLAEVHLKDREIRILSPSLCWYIMPTLVLLVISGTFWAGRVTAAQRCPHHNSWNLWVCYLTWQKGLCRYDSEIILAHPGGPNVITKLLKNKRGRQESQRRRYDNKSRGHSDSIVWGTSMSQRMYVASRGWKRPGNRFCLRVFRTESSPLLTLWS